MKTPKGIREHDADELRKDEEDDENLLGTTRRESVLDYLDEGDDEEE